MKDFIKIKAADATFKEKTRKRVGGYTYDFTSNAEVFSVNCH